MRFYHVILVLFILGLTSNLQAQNKAIIKLYDGSKIVGTYVEDTLDKNTYNVVLITGDTVSIHDRFIASSRLPKDVNVFSKSKFHYKDGAFLHSNIGLSPGRHFTWNIGFSYIFKNKFEIGADLGVSNNTFIVPGTTFSQWVSVTGFPITLTGKYYLVNESSRLYLKGAVGSTNSITTWEVRDVNNSFTAEGGIGISFASKSRTKWYLELGQYTAHARGIARNWQWDWTTEQTSSSDINFNVWFNRVVFRVGVLFGTK